MLRRAEPNGIVSVVCYIEDSSNKNLTNVFKNRGNSEGSLAPIFVGSSTKSGVLEAFMFSYRWAVCRRGRKGGGEEGQARLPTHPLDPRAGTKLAHYVLVLDDAHAA